MRESSEPAWARLLEMVEPYASPADVADARAMRDARREPMGVARPLLAAGHDRLRELYDALDLDE